MPDFLMTMTIHNEVTADSKPTVQERIVRAKTEAQAIKYVVSDTIVVRRANLDDAIRVGKIETAIGTLAGE